MKSTTEKIVISAMFASLVCVATMIVKIPSPLNGYINLGDAFVLLAGWFISPIYGFLAAGIGSALADLFSGYVSYAPATFLIKGIMAIIAFYGFKLIGGKAHKIIARLISGFAAEIFMVLGYYLFEGVLYGFIPSVVNILPNAVQGLAGIIAGCLMINVFNKHKILK